MSPLAIYQAALDVVSVAILRGDFASYAAMIDLPYLVHTETALLVIATEAELLPNFCTLSEGLTRRGITHYERIARTADYAGRDRIEGRHQTHLIAGGTFAAPSWRSANALVRRDSGWRFTEGRYRLKAATWPMTDAMLFETAPHPPDAAAPTAGPH